LVGDDGAEKNGKQGWRCGKDCTWASEPVCGNGVTEWPEECKQQSELFITLSGCLGSLPAPETAILLPSYSRNTPIGNNMTDIVGR
jgi:hypothetical protein